MRGAVLHHNVIKSTVRSLVSVTVIITSAQNSRGSFCWRYVSFFAQNCNKTIVLARSKAESRHHLCLHLNLLLLLLGQAPPSVLLGYCL